MEMRQKPRLHTDWIEPEAHFIVERLQRAGFTTYLVGGCVRDLLAGIHPKDYDIATSAHPEQIRKLIRGSYIIGKRFRLVLAKRGPHQFEIATFRRNALPEEIEASELSFADNFFGSPQEDAQRRDFTVNALFYDPVNDELIDYVNGVQDIEQGFLRMIGDPDYRLKEDPIRILRAIRLSHKLRFSIEESLRKAIEDNAMELTRAILPRKREEYFKLLRLSDPSLVFQELEDLKILEQILPTLSHLWKEPANGELLRHFLSRTHEIAQDPLGTTWLMLPLLLAFNEIHPLLDSPHYEKVPDSENSPESQKSPEPQDSGESEATERIPSTIDHFFKNEWGLFRTEQQSLFEALYLTNQINQIDEIMRKGPRRQRNFFQRENMPLALKMAQANLSLSGEQWLKINRILKMSTP